MAEQIAHRIQTAFNDACIGRTFVSQLSMSTTWPSNLRLVLRSSAAPSGWTPLTLSGGWHRLRIRGVVTIDDVGYLSDRPDAPNFSSRSWRSRARSSISAKSRNRQNFRNLQRNSAVLLRRSVMAARRRNDVFLSGSRTVSRFRRVV